MTRFRTETGSAPSGSEGIREDRERLRADNAALKQQLDVMRALAFRDQLTGLFSRHYLTDYLEQDRATCGFFSSHFVPTLYQILKPIPTFALLGA